MKAKTATRSASQGRGTPRPSQDSRFKPFWVSFTPATGGPRVWHKVTKIMSIQNNFTRCGKRFLSDGPEPATVGWKVPKAVRRSPPTALKTNERICKVCGLGI